MRVPSPKPLLRRDPLQQRASQRVEQVLDAAAAVMAEAGYEAATMTQIAERAGASIGTVYKYFLNKESIVLALRKSYGEAMEERLVAIESAAANWSVDEIASYFIEMTKDFIEQHPAYIHVLDAPVKAVRDREARGRLRERIARIVQGKAPHLSSQRAMFMADVSVQIIKGMNPLYVKASAQDRKQLLEEYKLVLASYMHAHVEAG